MTVRFSIRLLSTIALATAVVFAVGAVSAGDKATKTKAHGRAAGMGPQSQDLDPVGADRVMRTAPLPPPAAGPGGAVYVPAELKIIATQELDRGITNPIDLEETAAAQKPSSAQSVSANVRANNTAGDAANTTNSENAIAMWGNYGVTGWNDGLNFGVSPGNSGYATTTDGGATWVDGGVPPVPTPSARYEGDPSLAVDNAGYFYYANLYTPDGIASSISVNRGQFIAGVFSWNMPVLPVGATTTDFLDKEWIAVNPVNGYVYLTYTRFFAAGGNQIEFTRSIDNGATWSSPMALSSPATENCQGSRVYVGPTGEVQTIYFVYDFATGNNYMRARRSTDNGVSFAPEVTLPTGPNGIFSNYGSGPAGFNRAGGVGFPSLTIDRTGGPFDGRVYACWEETVNYYFDPLGGLGGINETEANGSSATANPIVIGQAVVGTMSSSADQDWFSFNGVAGQTVVLFLIPGSAPAGDGYLRVFAGGGATANRAQLSYLGGGYALCVFTPPSNGTYYFRVLDASGTSSGNYVVYTGNHIPTAEDIGRDQRDVIVQTSADGTVWNARHVANDDAPRFDNAWPEVAVDACGMAYIDWMDHRNDPANGIVSDVYYSRSSDGGATFGASTQVNDGPSVNWNLVASNLAPNMGDYWNLVSDGPYVYANFADGRQGTPDSWVARIFDCQATATQLALRSIEATPDRVDIEWFNSGDPVTAVVYRRDVGTDWTSVGTIQADGTGHMAFTDRNVVPGTRYDYRLGVAEATGMRFFGDASIQVPALDVAFALRVTGGHPVGSDLTVSYSLPRAEAATLSLLDVSGRMVRSVALEPRIGSGSVQLSRSGALPSGVYLVRLRQGAASATSKAVVVER
jgi:hypothetical protein